MRWEFKNIKFLIFNHKKKEFKSNNLFFCDLRKNL